MNAAGIHFIAAYLLWVGARYAQIKIKEIRGIAELTKACENAGLILFDEPLARKAHYIVYISIAAFASLEISAICLVAMNRDFSLKSIKQLWTDTSIFMQCTVNTHYMLMQLVMIRLFQKLLAEIKLTVERRFDGNAEGSKNDQDMKGSFLSRLRILHRLYQSAYLNFTELEKFVNPAFIIWWNVVLIDNVICAYILINSFMMHEPLGLQTLFFMLLYYGTFVGLIIFLILMGTLASVVSLLFVAFLLILLFHIYTNMFDTNSMLYLRTSTCWKYIPKYLFCNYIYRAIHEETKILREPMEQVILSKKVYVIFVFIVVVALYLLHSSVHDISTLKKALNKNRNVCIQSS